MSIITSEKDLLSVCDEISKAGRFGMDLEFIPERTYDPELCLIQIATDDAAYIIDPLAIRDLMPLWEKVADPNLLVVLHAPDQDLYLAWRYSGLVPKNIFDTQMAAGFAGYGYPLGYGKLLERSLSVNLSKTESYTDWLQRPLTQEQITYAIDDVKHLLPLYDQLTAALNTMGRLAWAQEECHQYDQEEFYVKDKTRNYLKVKGASGLSRRQIAVLKHIVDWRDQEAYRVNKPPKAILSDNVILELARRPPKIAKDIERIRSVRPDQVRNFGQAILAAVQEGLAAKESDWQLSPPAQIPTRKEVLQADLLFWILKIICHRSDLAPELVATRDELQALIRFVKEGNAEVPDDLTVLSGWRKDVAGSCLLDVLSGANINIQMSDGAEAVSMEIGGKMTFEDKWADVNGLRLHYVQSGNSGKVMLFLHGFPEFWYAWKDQLKEFGQDHKAIALDMRGYNVSDKPSAVDAYAWEKLVDDVKGLLKIVSHGEKAYLVAHDWGGIVAWHFALRHPDMLEKLIIINSPHPTIFANMIISNQEQRKASGYMLMLRSNQAESELAKDDYAVLRKAVFGVANREDAFSEEDKAAYLEAWSQPGALTGGLNYYRAANVGVLAADATKAMLHTKLMRKPPGDTIVRVPTLVIWGEKDKSILPCNLNDLDKHVPKLKVVRVPNGTHWVVHEEPAHVNKTIRDYIGQDAGH